MFSTPPLLLYGKKTHFWQLETQQMHQIFKMGSSIQVSGNTNHWYWTGSTEGSFILILFYFLFWLGRTSHCSPKLVPRKEKMEKSLSRCKRSLIIKVLQLFRAIHSVTAFGSENELTTYVN